jgi:hypothetical protein
MRIGLCVVDVAGAAASSPDPPHFSPSPPNVSCMACYQPLRTAPIPIPQTWKTTSSPFFNFHLAGWVCGVDCLHELMRLGLEACPDTLNITRLCLLRHDITFDITPDTYVSRAPEVLAQTGWSPPGVQIQPYAAAPPVRVQHMFMSPDICNNPQWRPQPHVRCLNCLAAGLPELSIPVCTQLVVCGYTTDTPEADVQAYAEKNGATVTRDPDGVYVHASACLTDTEEEFWLGAPFSSEPFECFYVYGFVCSPGCLLHAVGEPGGCGWKVSETGSFYSALNTLHNFMYNQGLPENGPDLYAHVFRRSRWCGTAAELDPDAFIGIPEFNGRDIEQEQSSIPPTAGGVCPLDEAIKALPQAFSSIRHRLEAARSKKIPD